MDRQGSGVIRAAELEAALRACGISLTAVEMDRLLAAVDAAPEGGVPIAQTLAALRGPLSGV